MDLEKQKKGLLLILAKKHGGAPLSEPEETEEPSAFEDLADDILTAIENKDKAALAEALKAFDAANDAEEHEDEEIE